MTKLFVEQKKTLSTDDFVVALVEVAMTLGTNPIEISWDDNLFSRESDVQLWKI